LVISFLGCSSASVKGDLFPFLAGCDFIQAIRNAYQECPDDKSDCQCHIRSSF